MILLNKNTNPQTLEDIDSKLQDSIESAAIDTGLLFSTLLFLYIRMSYLLCSCADSFYFAQYLAAKPMRQSSLAAALCLLPAHLLITMDEFSGQCTMDSPASSPRCELCRR